MKDTQPSKSGFTLIELLVVVAVIAILAAITIPAVNKALESSRRSRCRSNLRQCAVACTLYAEDHGERHPEAAVAASTNDWGCAVKDGGVIQKWGLLYGRYLTDNEVFWCPSRRNGNRYAVDSGSPDYGRASFPATEGEALCESSYAHLSGTVASPLRLRQIAEPSKRLLGVDVFWSTGSEPTGASACHRDGFHNTVYFDGHVSAFADEARYLETLSTGLDAGYSYIEAHDNE